MSNIEPNNYSIFRRAENIFTKVTNNDYETLNTIIENYEHEENHNDSSRLLKLDREPPNKIDKTH